MSCNFDGPRGNNLLVAVADDSPSGHAKAVVKLGGKVVDLVAREAGDYEPLFEGRLSFVGSNVIVKIDVSKQEPELVGRETSRIGASMTLRTGEHAEARTVAGQWNCGA